jgi:hypothetical protein
MDAVLELVGTPTLPDTLRATRVHGTVCFPGMVSSEWVMREFYSIAYIPRSLVPGADSGSGRLTPRSQDRGRRSQQPLRPDPHLILTVRVHSAEVPLPRIHWRAETLGIAHLSDTRRSRTRSRTRARQGAGPGISERTR